MPKSRGLGVEEVVGQSRGVRSAGILPYYLISGKALYKESDIQQMLEKAYRPLSDNRNLV